jgi:transcriptional regulator with XRE-family HTH domain
MSKLADLVNAPGFQLEVKQFECVLDYITAIEQAMEAKQVTQSALARTLGKTRAWVSKVLGKKRNLTFFTAVELADALEMDVHVRVVSRTASQLHVLDRLSGSYTVAASSEGDVGWTSAGVQMRPLSHATVIPFPRAA